ncbi:dienelactone hydrolase family protein [Dietzia sp. 179-F 9C3 NHS]|uniref:dienelactone hydrolase family protein n=1 Tax=Dietzia sp. 179-F 9C3 NHS TaxID=3374295 RepID=UPI00387A56DA
MTPIADGPVRGFHLRPDVIRHRGVVLVWGGSEGGPDFPHAELLAREGHEVLSLFYFGQPEQPEQLNRVPVETAAGSRVGARFGLRLSGAPAACVRGDAGGADRGRQAHRPKARTGEVLIFAGGDDQLWPADAAARRFAVDRPDAEVHVYPGAGHVFDVPGDHAEGMRMGGTAEANAAARADSDRILTERLASWHR